FSSRRRHTRFSRDWSSDVCSSDLEGFTAIAVDDEVIGATIARRSERHGEVFCPHTATAVHVLETLRADGAQGDWAVAATAHPAKFEAVVEPLVGRPVEVPPALAALLARPASAEPVRPDYDALRERILG